MVWKDLSSSDVTATLSSTFEHNGTNGWTENGLLFPQATTEEFYNVDAIYPSGSYSAMTFELVITPISELGVGGGDYVYPLRMYKSDGNNFGLSFGIRKNVILMYGSGHNNVFSSGVSIDSENRYTISFVQNNLTTRSLYIDGVLKENKSDCALNSILFERPRLRSHAKGSYIIHSLRIYNKALNQEEILSNYNNDILRFGE